ncbi:MAG: serine hydrolase domain-containing protein [Saprospiraceae bacterium]
MSRNVLAYLIILLLGISCSKDETVVVETSPPTKMYFPSTTSEEWEQTSLSALNWETSAEDDLYNYLEANGTRAFMLLKDGKIVIEKYWGTSIQGNASFTQNSNWYWASAGKTLTAFLIGIAQENTLLNINHTTTDYLGEGWTSLTAEKENLIQIKHQLTMTTGLDYDVTNLDCTTPDCLQYKADAGSQWFYHNAPYTLLGQIVETVSGQSYNQFTNEKLGAKIGMNGTWIKLGDNTVYWSTARDAARFGLLLLNKGTWEEEQILADQAYLEAMTSPSQNLNPAYGYCTWLNGQTSIVYPGLPNSFNTQLSNQAPADLYAALGKNGQVINVVPSQGLVVVRMGEAPDNALVPVVFHDAMWEKINAIID